MLCHVPLLAQRGLAGRLTGSEALFARLPGVWAAETYSASLAFQKNMMVGCYGEKKFLSDLSVFNLQWSGVVVRLPIQLSLSREGTTAFSHSSYVVSAARKLGKGIQIGMNAGYAGFRAGGYDSWGEIIAGAGALVQVSGHCRIGIQLGLRNDIREKNDARFSVRSGLGYSLSELCSLTIELSKESGKPAVTDVGIYYAFHPKFFGRMGYCPALSLASFNLGYQHRNFRAELEQSIHLSLGATWGLSCMYRFKAEE